MKNVANININVKKTNILIFYCNQNLDNSYERGGKTGKKEVNEFFLARI